MPPEQQPQPPQPLGDYLNSFSYSTHDGRRRKGGSVGAELEVINLAKAALHFTVYTPATVESIVIAAHTPIDWCFAADHLLLEGHNPLELVTEDEKLTPEYLRSLDREGVGRSFPERVVMLRNGPNWMIAEAFSVFLCRSESLRIPV